MRSTRAFRCPQCGAPAEVDDFQCERCELILNPDSATAEGAVPLGAEPDTPSVVRAMLSPPTRAFTAEVPEPPRGERARDLDITANFDPPLQGVLPRVVAEIDIALSPLHPFEAYLASFIDGRHTARELAEAARLGEMEVVAVLHSLKTRGVVVFVPRPAPEESPLPTQLEGRLQQAIIFERQGQLDRAIAVLRAAIAGAPRAAALYHKLALILLTHRRDHEQAEELFLAALRLEPSNPVFRQNLEKVRQLATAAAAVPEKKPGLLSRWLNR